MLSLKNVRIATKISGIVLVLSLLAVGYVVYLSGQMRRVSTEYASLLDNQAEGSLWLSRANRRVLQIGYEAYKVIGYDGASQQAVAAFQAYKGSVNRYAEMFDRAEALLPAKATELRAIRAQVGEITRLCLQAIEAGLKNDNPRALKIMEQVDPLVEKVGSQALALTRLLSEDTKAETIGLAASTESSANRALIASIIVGLLGLASALLVSSRGITGPLARLQSRMRDMAEGRLDTAIDDRDRRDEVGAMAAAVQVFKENALRSRALEAEAADSCRRVEEERASNEMVQARLAREQAAVVASLAQGLTRLSDGDLTYRLSDAFAQDYEALRADFNAAMVQLQNTMEVVAGNTAGIHSGSGEISQAADNLSRRTEQQAASLEETAAALDEITATVRKTAEGATSAQQVVADAKAGAEHSKAVVGDAVAAMGQIEKSSEEIGQIVGVIDEIAFQTNLLALNAGVEAARAGEAGRGFAVVASEVRALAQRSAQAAKEIKTLISASSAQVSSGVALVGETGEALSRIVMQVGSIDTIVTEIAASAREQATALNEVNTAVNQMDQMTQQNAAMVEESTAASHSLAHEAGELSNAVGRFRIAADARPDASRAPRKANPTVSPLSPKPSRPAPLRFAATQGNLALKDPGPAENDWEEF